MTTCHYCFQPRANTIDHKTPLSRGGAKDKENTVPACITCNGDKGPLTEYEYLRLRGTHLLKPAVGFMLREIERNRLLGRPLYDDMDFDVLVTKAKGHLESQRSKAEKRANQERRKALRKDADLRLRGLA